MLCCAVLFGSCKSEESKEGPPSNENGANEDKGDGSGSPASDGKNPTKPGDRIRTGQPAADDAAPDEGDGGDPEISGPAPGEPPSTGGLAPGSYYTIVNLSDDSYIEVVFLNSFGVPDDATLGAYDCVQITEAEFQNNIISITRVDVDDGEEELFCGEGCDEEDCYAECPVDNYRMLDGLFWDSIEIEQRLSLRGNCVPLFQF